MPCVPAPHPPLRPLAPQTQHGSAPSAPTTAGTRSCPASCRATAAPCPGPPSAPRVAVGRPPGPQHPWAGNQARGFVRTPHPLPFAGGIPGPVLHALRARRYHWCACVRVRADCIQCGHHFPSTVTPPPQIEATVLLMWGSENYCIFNPQKIVLFLGCLYLDMVPVYFKVKLPS